MDRLHILKKALKIALGERECTSPTPRELDSDDIDDALTCYNMEAEEPLDYFSISEIEYKTIEELREYGDFGSWVEIEPDSLKGLSDNEKMKEISSFRGGRWPDIALDWIRECSVPPIVVIEGKERTMIGDGRGRINVAVGMGWKSLPVVFLTENN